MTARHFVMIASCLAMMPVAAYGQETGTLLTHRPATVDGRAKKFARRTTLDYAACVVETRPAAAASFVSLPIDSPDYPRRLKIVLDNECLSEGGISFAHVLLRGALYSALYNRTYGRSGPTDFSAVPPIDYAAGYTGALSDQAANVIALGQFGDCVVRAGASDVRNLLLNEPESVGEKEALRFIVPRLGPCVVKGQTVNFSKSALRSALAEAMYRLSQAATTKS